MPELPPSIRPRGIIMRPSVRPRPALPASAVYIQSVSGLSWSVETAAGIDSAAGGESPASTRATVADGSSDNLEAITAPADPPPTTTKSKTSAIPVPLFQPARSGAPARSLPQARDRHAGPAHECD